MANHHAAVLPLALDFGPDPGPAGAMYTELLLPEVSQGPGGISDAHRRAGEEDVASHAGGKEALAGLARADTRPQRQAKPLNAEPLGTPQAADRRGRVDVAICAVLRDGPLRRSEAADLRWEDVTFQASGARGALLEVRRSKTCWPSGRPTLTRRPRSSGSPTDRSAGQVRAAALHAGTELTNLQNAGRWQSPSMPARYSRGQKARGPAAARWPGTTGSTGETLPLCGGG